MVAPPRNKNSRKRSGTVFELNIKRRTFMLSEKCKFVEIVASMQITQKMRKTSRILLVHKTKLSFFVNAFHFASEVFALASHSIDLGASQFFICLGLFAR